MANLRDIKKRITSVSSTKQITRTMEMVATAKIRKASERIQKATPYAESMMKVLAGLASHVDETSHPLLARRQEKRHATFIVVASDRGLAGGFNSSVLHAAYKRACAYEDQGIKVSYILCGKKAHAFFTYRGIEPVMKFLDLSSDPTLTEARQISSYVSQSYARANTDEVIVFYNHARNAADQDLREEMLLPVDPIEVEWPSREGDAQLSARSHGAVSFEFEPDAEAVFKTLLPAYVETMVYHALLDSAAAEQGARRRAMKSATDNATEIINTLNRSYNRARQAAITTEINEIVGGAAGLEEE